MISPRQVEILRFMEEIEQAAQRERAARAKRATPYGVAAELDDIGQGRRPTPPPPSPPKPKARQTPPAGFLDDLKRRPRVKGAPAPMRLGQATPAPSVAVAAASGGKSPAALLGAGYQPAVLKVISYGHGVSRASAMATYVQRDEAALETHDGRLLETREEAADEMRRWAAGFQSQKPSNDVATFTVRIDGQRQGDDESQRLRQAVAAGFIGHSYAYRLEEDGQGRMSAHVVASLAGRTADRASERFYVTEGRSRDDGRLARKSAATLTERIAAATDVPADRVHIAVNAPAHGRAGLVSQLARASQKEPLTTHDGKPLAGDINDIRQTATKWERGLRSHTPRDTMHMILSAKAGTDETTLTNAARSFFQQTFANHNFVFALHNDKAANGHIHVHAVVAVRGEDGQRLNPGRDTFREWRQVYAQAAQAEGIKITAVNAMQRASSQSYGPRDKAIVDAADRPRAARAEKDRAYSTLNPAVVQRSRDRIANARANPVRVPYSDRQLAVVNASYADFSAQPGAAHNPLLAGTMERLAVAAQAGKVIIALKTTMKGNPGMATNSEAMREELRILNRQAGDAAASLSGESKEQFMRTAGQTLNLMALRADLQDMKERGVKEVTPQDMQRLMTAETMQLVAKAHAVAATERQEAERAEVVAKRAVEAERQSEGTPSRDPEAIREVAEDRDTTRAAETIAGRERREADAAQRAADSIAASPAKPIDPNTALNDRIAQLKREQEAAEAATDKAKPQKL